MKLLSLIRSMIRGNRKDIIGFYFPYDYKLQKRYGGTVPVHAGLEKLLGKNSDAYTKLLTQFAEHLPTFLDLSYEQQNDTDPYWDNEFFPFLDLVALYGIIAHEKPKRFIEIGSGNSTKIVHYARSKLSLDLHITSIDPSPVREIDSLCDRILRYPLQDIDQAIFDELEEGDVLFFDGSHLMMQNTDCEVFFFEIMPKLKLGVIIHIHDIEWPHDYCDQWASRLYGEQYVLGAMLLYAPDMFEVIFPSSYVSRSVPYPHDFKAIWERKGFENLQNHRGLSFWFRKLGTNEALDCI